MSIDIELNINKQTSDVGPQPLILEVSNMTNTVTTEPECIDIEITGLKSLTKFIGLEDTPLYYENGKFFKVQDNKIVYTDITWSDITGRIEEGSEIQKEILRLIEENTKKYTENIVYNAITFHDNDINAHQSIQNTIQQNFETLDDKIELAQIDTTNKFEKVNKTIDTLEEKHDVDIKNLDDYAKDVNTRLEALTLDVNVDVKDSIKQLQTDLGITNQTVSNNYNTLDTKIDNTKSDIEQSISDKEDTLNTKIDTLEEKHDTDVANINKTISDNKQDSDTKLDTLEKKHDKDVSDLTTKIDNDIKDLQDFKTLVHNDQAVTDSAIKAVDKKADNINTDLQGYKTSNNNKITEVEGKISDNKTNIENNAGKITDLTDTVMDQGKLIINNKKLIDQTIENLKSYTPTSGFANIAFTGSYTDLINVPNLATQEYVNNAVGNLVLFDFVIVDTLPEVGESNHIYLVKSTTSGTQNVYEEYLWIKETNSYEIIGTTVADLSNYYTKKETDTLLTNYVHLNTDQVIDGKKTFASKIEFKNGIAGKDQGAISAGADTLSLTSTGDLTIHSNKDLTISADEDAVILGGEDGLVRIYNAVNQDDVPFATTNDIPDISGKQDKLTAGTGIKIENNVISNTQTSAEWGNIQGDITKQTDLNNNFLSTTNYNPQTFFGPKSFDNIILQANDSDYLPEGVTSQQNVNIEMGLDALRITGGDNLQSIEARIPVKDLTIEYNSDYFINTFNDGSTNGNILGLSIESGEGRESETYLNLGTTKDNFSISNPMLINATVYEDLYDDKDVKFAKITDIPDISGKQNKLTPGTGINITDDNIISLSTIEVIDGGSATSN